MAHKKEFISTGGGFSVLNDGVKTEVIAQDGTIKGDIKDALAYGSIYIGNASGVTSELSIKTDGGILIGNGTTAEVKTLSGDATMTNAGAVTVAKIKGAALGTTTATNTNLLVADGSKWESVAMSGDATITNAGAVTVAKIKGATLGTTTATEANLLIADGSKWETVAMSGDATITKAGAVTIGNGKVTASKLSYEVVEVTVAADGTTGTGTVTAGSIILGCYPISNQDQFVDSIAVSETTLTITLAAAATADNKFKVVLLKA